MDVNCTVITGYHGTSSNYAESIEKHGLDPDKTHTRPDHWLGQGVYFFEDSDLAKWWACDISGKNIIRGAIRSYIRLRFRHQEKKFWIWIIIKNMICF